MAKRIPRDEKIARQSTVMALRRSGLTFKAVGEQFSRTSAWARQVFNAGVRREQYALLNQANLGQEKGVDGHEPPTP